MEIRILSLEDGAELARGTVIIIDVFRAFTTEAIAFQHGVEKIFLTEDVQQAVKWRTMGVAEYIMGEVDGIMPGEFDYDNSPRHFIENPSKFSGKPCIHRSSSGTQGIVLSSVHAEQIYAGSFLTAEATIQEVLRQKSGIVSIVAMGVAGKYRADEDELCAYYLRSRLEGRSPDTKAIKTLIRQGNTYQSYRRFADGNYPGDAEIALEIDRCDFAIRIEREEDKLVSRPVTHADLP